MGDERRVVPIDEAIRRIGRRKHIHTLMSSSFALIGADHERDGLIEKMRTHGVEESGAQAAAMGHTLVIANYVNGRPLFIEAKPRAATKVRDAKRAVTPSASAAQKSAQK